MDILDITEEDIRLYFDVGLAIVLVVLTIVALFFNRLRVTIRKFKKAKKILLGDAKDNQLVRFRGQVVVKEPLIAPLSQRPCAVYYIKVEKPGDYRRNYIDAKTYIEDTKGIDFLLKNDEHYAFVRFQKAVFLFDKDHSDCSGTFDDADETMEALLEKYGMSSTNFLGFNKDLAYYEAVFEINEFIAVCGVGVWEDIDIYPQLTFLKEQGINKVYVFKTDRKNRLQVSDNPDILKLR